MKIISKHKDYYDYLQGVYGIDEKIVYDRRAKHIVRHQDVVHLSDFLSDLLYHHQFAIANKMWTLYEYKGKVYHTPEELVTLNAKLKKDGERELLRYSKWSSIWGKTPEESARIMFDQENGETDVNKALRQPVLIRTNGGEFTHTKVKINNGYYSHWYDTDKKESSHWSIPILSDFGLPTYYPADELYQDVSSFMAWMVDNPPIPDKMTNGEKIHSHGFDKKISFRHRKDE